MNFNFWFIFAPLGAVVAVYIGYLVQGKCYASFLRKYLAVPMGIIFGLLLGLESHRGGTQLMLNTIAKDDFEAAVFFMIVGFAFVAWRYGKLIQKLVLWGEELNYPAAVRKVRREKQDYTITRVIPARAIGQALRQVAVQEYEDILEQMMDLADGLEWIDLDEAPEPKVAEEVEVIPSSQITVEPTLEVVPQTVNYDQHPDAFSTLQDLKRQLSAEDAQLVAAMFAQKPGLLFMLTNPNVFATIEIVGEGPERYARIKSAVYPRKQVV